MLFRLRFLHNINISLELRVSVKKRAQLGLEPRNMMPVAVSGQKWRWLRLAVAAPAGRLDAEPITG
jgi:hypothetical protein